MCQAPQVTVHGIVLISSMGRRYNAEETIKKTRMRRCVALRSMAAADQQSKLGAGQKQLETNDMQNGRWLRQRVSN
jgi:hypothetical protein